MLKVSRLKENGHTKEEDKTKVGTQARFEARLHMGWEKKKNIYGLGGGNTSNNIKR